MQHETTSKLSTFLYYNPLIGDPLPTSWKDYPSGSMVHPAKEGVKLIDAIYYNENSVIFFDITLREWTTSYKSGGKVPNTTDKEKWIQRLCEVVRQWIGSEYFDVKVEGAGNELKAILKEKKNPPQVTKKNDEIEEEIMIVKEEL